MTSAQVQFRSGRHGLRGISLPDMAPFAGVVFLLLLPYLLGRFQLKAPQAGLLIPDTEQAFSSTVCWRGDADGLDGVLICLNASNQLSFALPGYGQEFQAAVINQVAVRHKVKLSLSQQCSLEALPFLATDVQQLPHLLTLTKPQSVATVLSGNFEPLSAKQLADCILATRVLALSSIGRPLQFYLKIGANVKAPQVWALTDLLQEQGINRFSMLTQMKE
jgi:hypothetical protein